MKRKNTPVVETPPPNPNTFAGMHAQLSAGRASTSPTSTTRAPQARSPLSTRNSLSWLDPWRCPFGVRPCESAEAHRAHPGARALASDPSSDEHTLAMLSYNWAGSVEILTALLARRVVRGWHTKHIVDTIIGTTGMTGDTTTRDHLVELLLHDACCDKARLSELARVPMSAEAASEFLAHPACGDAEELQLAWEGRGRVNDGRHEAIAALGTPTARLAVSLLGMPASTFADVRALRKAARQIGALAPRRREAYLSLIHGLAPSWEGDALELARVARECL